MSARDLFRWPLLLVVWLTLSLPVVGHDDDSSQHQHASSDNGSVAVQHRSRGLLLPQVTGAAHPWSQKPILNNPDRFHFAVVTDRTGGHRPGIWMHAVRNLNLLRPEFVVSVGDLIEGYTEDTVKIRQQWDEFLGFIDELQMKFFFVAGNHDVTNPVMQRVWRKRFGRPWYSFDYKGVHFLCLLSEDPSARIGAQQLRWAMTDLQEHADARWTFVFMHKPLWVYAEREQAAGNEDSTNWKQLEAELAGRPHTVFAGHVHHYVQFQRNGREYYQLATTGGSSRLRGNHFGEFDHIVWVTMEDDAPRIANIVLNGVLAADVVTESSIRRFREFLAGSRIRIQPVLVETGDRLQSAEFEVKFINDFDEQVQFDARLTGLPLKGLTVDRDEIRVQVAPHDSESVMCRLELVEPLSLDQFRGAQLTAKVATKELSAEVVAPVTVGRRHLVPRVSVEVDGQLGEWSGEMLGFAELPAMYGPSAQWQGQGDASVDFQVAYDDEFVYLGGVVTDDKVLLGDDWLSFLIDARSFEGRLADSQLGDHCFTVRLEPNAPSNTATVQVSPRRGKLPAGPTHAALQRTATGYSFEVALPQAYFTAGQGDPWNSFQMNVMLRDRDEPADDELDLIWHANAGRTSDNSSYAHFFRNGQQEK